MSLNFDLKLTFPSGKSLQVIPDPSGFLLMKLLAADGSVLDSETVAEEDGNKFLRQLSLLHSARISDLG